MNNNLMRMAILSVCFLFANSSFAQENEVKPFKYYLDYVQGPYLSKGHYLFG
ncbi:MAG: hypothetical protein ACI85O_003740 [Saprospiraceae bacterium]|jgi:hypothetical protein